MTKVFETNGEAETKALASRLAQLVKSGMTILLEGELGAGKTTFTKGFAEGLGIERIIKSPTYTLIREYTQGRLPLYHMDLYRLENTGAEEMGLDEYFDGEGICIVEWGSVVEEELPQNHLLIQMDTSLIDINQRTLTMSAVGEVYEKVLKELEDERKD
ncbi:tRNA (adenosine(37)-N6)-threonylcarbamoyltransferase complex ATPase subunit type 1 TsaE [Marinilactibacillus psychrotolerans]|uniref:tRNA threonylcarbamoyladenosine biosynthesis protein TsaE n=1 Tax=Marinilactibacillus psychrotolerans TaxID=191770 RepID=A0AAV3WRF0_9LACT|nr:tRNA (adenosine(37)-N6)-threonylcarbamoyltransferase complex ATPase subunit type 1 TsaE [Marinilactibacillus psychrotolerans]GEL66641.1 tRNA (adenosine(37)-N6)-threonylcarbamoyltransferase complex ATPase subunit type 1 TsaE [Marinilactibacillus psychrotolerans]GEQ35163.1 tRNA threonylcarbamoyladenosine biosynthesis protein TsaE [Marinilactibacillus psychrotolerans]SDC84201.1 tRNA threonylcarbamoyladenosine biosynthesis protein TsaE [Marinilactibacillus psychrotolerans]